MTFKVSEIADLTTLQAIENDNMDNENHTISTILMLIANEKLKNRDHTIKVQFQRCINATSSIPTYAKCLVKLLRTRTKYGKSGYTVTRRGNYNLVDPAARVSQIARTTEFQPIVPQPKRTNFTLLDQHHSQPITFDAMNFPGQLFRSLSKTYPKMFDGSDESSPAILSPNFMPSVEVTGPKSRSILSPTIFSFFESNKTSNLHSLPSLLKTLPSSEQEMWLKFINQTTTAIRSGVERGVLEDTAKLILKHHGVDNPDETLSRTRRFYGSLSEEKLKLLNSRGYIFVAGERNFLSKFFFNIETFFVNN